MKNGKPWLDTDGNPIRAHGGWMLEANGWTYWYGEDRRDEYFVSCYRTKDFVNFEFRGHPLTASSPAEKSYVVDADLSLTHAPGEIDGGDHPLGLIRKTASGRILVNLERPKVLYCPATGKYVMWMHYENGVNYSCARCAVASCDTPDGNFTYHGSFNPFGNMARDCTVFEQGGDAFFAATARDNRDLLLYRMTEDYLSVDQTVNALFQNQSREAPAFFEREGKTFLLTSGCSGWAPNQGAFAMTKENSLSGRWTLLRSFGDSTTFDSQPAFVLQRKGEYYYVGDRWGHNSEEYELSTYVALKIQFDGDGNPFIEYSEEAGLPAAK